MVVESQTRNRPETIGDADFVLSVETEVQDRRIDHEDAGRDLGPRRLDSRRHGLAQGGRDVELGICGETRAAVAIVAVVEVVLYRVVVEDRTDLKG